MRSRRSTGCSPGRRRSSRGSSDVQLAGDGLIVSGLVHMTGGITSYLLDALHAADHCREHHRSRRGGALVGYAQRRHLCRALVPRQYRAGSLAPRSWRGRRAAAAAGWRSSAVGLNVFGFFAVAALSGYLAEGLRRADAQLQLASNQLADLQAFSQHVIDSLASGLATTDVRRVDHHVQPRRGGHRRRGRGGVGRPADRRGPAVAARSRRPVRRRRCRSPCCRASSSAYHPARRAAHRARA